MRSIHRGYIDGDPALSPFFSGRPEDLFGPRAATAPLYPGLREALAEYAAQIGSTASVPAGDVCAIVTGQQPALFTGPLYTIYKAATTIRLAERVALKTGVRCMPVYWIASDDHDFEEASTTRVLTKLHEPLELKYNPATSVEGLPMHRVPLESSLHELIDTMADAVTGSEFRDEVRAFLHESLDAAHSFSDWTARIFARLFRDTPLVFFTTELPVMREASVPVIKREIEEPLWSTQRVNSAERQLQSLDFETQLSKGDTDCGFFLEVEGRRCKVVYENGAFVLPENGVRYTPEALRKLLHDSPERFSPNAALRTIVQQRLFSAAAYIGGPGEVAYWAQFKSLFDDMGMTMPIVYPRAQVVLTSAKLKKLMARCGLEFNDFSAPLEDVEDKALAGTADGPALEALAESRAQIERSIQTLESKLSALQAPPLAVGERIMGELDKARRILERADAEKVATMRRNVARVANTLMPFRKPQERIYTAFSFLFEHGWDLVPRIIREIAIDSFNITEMEL